LTIKKPANAGFLIYESIVYQEYLIGLGTYI